MRQGVRIREPESRQEARETAGQGLKRQDTYLASGSTSEVNSEADWQPGPQPLSFEEEEEASTEGPPSGKRPALLETLRPVRLASDSEVIELPWKSSSGVSDGSRCSVLRLSVWCSLLIHMQLACRTSFLAKSVLDGCLASTLCQQAVPGTLGRTIAARPENTLVRGLLAEVAQAWDHESSHHSTAMENELLRRATPNSTPAEGGDSPTVLGVEAKPIPVEDHEKAPLRRGDDRPYNISSAMDDAGALSA